MRLMSIFLLLLMCAVLGPCFGQTLIFHDDFDGSTRGKSTPGVAFADGRDGLAALLNSGDDTIEYPAEAFACTAGRIEFDLKLTKPITDDHPHLGVLLDTGAGSGQNGSVAVLWRPGSDRLEFQILSGGQDWRHVYSDGVKWQVGKWYHIGLAYGVGGMRLEVDGKIVGTNDYTGGLAASKKKLGFKDSHYSTAPMMIDNLKCYRVHTDNLSVSSGVICPVKDGLFDSVVITYENAQPGKVMLDVVDKNGSVVAGLVDEVHSSPEYRTITWDGGKLHNGKYTVRLSIDYPSGKKEVREAVEIDNRWKWRDPGPLCRDFFSVGTYYFWESDSWWQKMHVDDPVEARKYYERTIKELADAGYNNIYAIWTPADHRKMVLDTAHKHGLKVVVFLHEIYSWITSNDKSNIFQLAHDTVKDIKGHPAVLGYYIIDEPANNPDVISRVSTAKRVLEAVDPKHPSFSCLIGGWDYGELLNTVDYQVSLVDIYTLGPNWSGDWSHYFRCLEQGKKLAGDRPFVVVPQAHGLPGGLKIPTPEELRAQVWLALAYGANGIVYFIYQSSTEIEGENLQGMVDMSLNKMDGRFEETARVNADLKKLGPILLKLKSADFTVPVTSDTIIAKGFTSPDGIHYVILANRDTKRRSMAVWTGPKAMDMLTGVDVGKTITLEPGAGKLLMISDN